MRSLYATNVYHYDHVLHAMHDVFGEVGLVRRAELTPEYLNRLESIKLPKKVLDLVARRARDRATVPHKSYGLGAMQVLHPVSARLGRSVTAVEYRRVTRTYARRVSSISSDYDILHFVEGLGHRALSQRRFALSICERRALHHAEYEAPIDPLGGFPYQPSSDPIGDILTSEYESADYILVYSEVAKNSFIARGFSADRVKVSPIPVGPQLERVVRLRNPHKLAFVGRGDIFKGLDVAVETIKALGAPYELHVAGPMSKEVQRWLSGKPQVKYLGLLGRKELRELYSTSALLLAPSSESFGLAIVEGVYHRLPVVSSPFVGANEYIPRSMHRTVESRDPLAWAETVEAVRRDGAFASEDLDGDIDRSMAELSLSRSALRLAKLYKQMQSEVSV